jgi:uncharacterized membrane protein YfcA
MLAFVSLAGFGMLKATAHTKLLNLGSNIGALIVFASFGATLWKIGLMMGVCQFLGAQLGSRLAMRTGATADQAAARRRLHRLHDQAAGGPGQPDPRLWLRGV